MDQPNKDKKKKKHANGDPIGATQPVRRTEEQEILDAKTAALAKTQEGKEHMAKAGQDVDIKTGRSTAKPFEGTFVPGDRDKGIQPRYIKNNKTVHADTSKKPGEAKRKFDKAQRMTDDARKETQDVHRYQVSGEENDTAKRKRKADQDLSNSEVNVLDKKNAKGNPLATKPKKFRRP